MAEPNASTPTLREDVAEWLEDSLDESTLPDGVEYAVRPWRRVITGDLDRYLVDVRLDRMTPGTTGGNRRVHTVSVHVVSPYRDEDDDLDALASVVLDALTTRAGGLRWTECQFAVRDDRYPCYAITLSLEDAP